VGLVLRARGIEAAVASGSVRPRESRVRRSPPTPDGSGEEKKRKSIVGSIIELVVIIAIALGLALGLQQWMVKPYDVPSGSMEPTLQIGQHYLVNRIGMEINGPHVGEIAVFHPPADAEASVCGPIPHATTPGGAACSQPVPHEASNDFVKRIVAGPGDEMYIKEGHVFRRAAGKGPFVAEKDSYIKPCEDPSELDCNYPKPIMIPPGHWFMMGDNRGGSDDSRYWGPVPTGWIIGGAIATYWPPDRIGTL
jgi:signal peptidase I